MGENKLLIAVFTVIFLAVSLNGVEIIIEILFPKQFNESVCSPGHNP